MLLTVIIYINRLCLIMSPVIMLVPVLSRQWETLEVVELEQIFTIGLVTIQPRLIRLK